MHIFILMVFRVFLHIVYWLSLKPYLVKFYLVWIEKPIHLFLLKSSVLAWEIVDPVDYLDLSSLFFEPTTKENLIGEIES